MNYEKLPKGYRYAATMDFVRNRKQMIAVTVLSLILVALPVVYGLVFAPVLPAWNLMTENWYLWFALAATLFAYIPLHELTHGVFMRALSGVRPKYGLKLPYAYAGSAVWFDRRSHVVIALAPVVIWSILLEALILALPPAWFWPVWIVQISNLSGSAGDIYCVWYLLRMDGDLLIQDTGVRMRIYRKATPPIEEKQP